MNAYFLVVSNAWSRPPWPACGSHPRANVTRKLTHHEINGSDIKRPQTFMLLTNSTKRIDMTECVFVLSASHSRLHLLPRLNSS